MRRNATGEMHGTGGYPILGRSMLAMAALVGLASTAAKPPEAAERVLQVGAFHDATGSYGSIQAAVDAARPGDWILIAPGVYHEQGSVGAGVLITTPRIHLRGLDRNGVIVDGTRPGFGTCTSAPEAQVRLPAGRNGIEVFKVDGVTIENLTVCNFLGASGSGGNEIWWNGGDGSGTIGMGAYAGRYLTASTTYFDPATGVGGQYGVFVSNARGPGVIEHAYASNMIDSSFYVGACPDCNAVLRHVHAQNSALGYSGTNAGGHLLIQDSEWDDNRVGIVPNSLANDDPPSPQDGACPSVAAKSCTIIEHNYVHDNNNANTPAAGLTAGAPVGTGIDLTGGRNNLVRNNTVERNGAWGILVNDYPDTSSPAVPTWCAGGLTYFSPPAPFDAILGPVIPCYFHAYGNRVEGNRFSDNGGFGNPTNGDLANAALPYAVTNCFRHNLDRLLGSVSTSPSNLQDGAVAGTCGAPWSPDTAEVAGLFLQVVCAAYGPASGACLPGAPGYPQPTTVRLIPIPTEATMDEPCDGVPDNAWCGKE
jgi:Right handed beta helix region